MATQEVQTGKTPNGGSRSIAYYQDVQGDPAEKEDAIRVEVVELDDDGNTVGRTYASLGVIE